MKRFGRVIKIVPEMIDAYRKLHAPEHPGVRNLLRDHHIHNYSIYLHRLDDENYYLFSYFEYTGDDFEKDMERLKNHSENQAWWTIIDPMQIPVQNREPDEKWAVMKEIYHNE